MSINNSNDKIENSYDFEAPMYCPYCSMPYTGIIEDKYTDIDPYSEDFDDNFNPEYRHRGRRRRRRRRRHRRRCRRNICEFPFFPLFYDYDDWYWY